MNAQAVISVQVASASWLNDRAQNKWRQSKQTSLPLQLSPPQKDKDWGGGAVSIATPNSLACHNISTDSSQYFHGKLKHLA